MKKLKTTAFWLILSGIAGAFIYQVIGVIQGKNRSLDRLAERISAERLERFERFIFGINLLFTIVMALVFAYFIYKLLYNIKTESKQGYISFLMVCCIIFAIFNGLSLLTGNFIALISLAINVAVIVGCVIQRNYEPTIENI